MSKHSLKSLSVGCAVLALAAAFEASAAVIANFDGGNGNTSADQFTGIANSGGWATAWSASSKATVSNTTPLSGSSGNYLAVDNFSATGASWVLLNRRYSNVEANGGIDTATKTHTVSFQFRWDSSVTGFTAAADILRLFDNYASSGSSNANTTWMIQTTGTQTGLLHFIEGDGAGGTTTAHSTGMTLATGSLYTVSVTVHPLVGGTTDVGNSFPTWDATISDGTASFSKSGMKFRNSSATSGRYLAFESQTSTANEHVTFALDNISITVPEPASMAALGMGALGLMMRRGRSD